MSDGQQKLLATAVHEAGHCVTLHLLGGRIDSVTIKKAIKKNELLLGFTYTQFLAPTDGNYSSRIISCLAGESAERNILGKKRDKGAVTDFRNANHFYKLMRDKASISKRRVPTGRQLIARTDAIIRKHRNAIKTLARLLLVAETLDGPTVHNILQREIR